MEIAKSPLESVDPQYMDLAPSSSRLQRKRASKACLTCRARKVRCDVTQHGSPCTNCTMDASPCVVKPRPLKYRCSSDSKKGSKTPHRKNSSLDITKILSVPSGTYATANVSSTANARQPKTAGKALPILDEIEDHDIRTNVKFSRELEKGEPRTLFQTQSPEPFPPVLLNDRVRNPGYSHFQESPKEEDEEIHDKVDRLINYGEYSKTFDSGLINFHPINSCCNSQPIGNLEYNVPFLSHSFLQLDDISHLSRQDTQYLEQQGCFQIPAKPALDEFVARYFLHVHPNLPILDEGAFWDLYDHSDENGPRGGRLSLFVFQAMLFTASSYVSSEILRKAGFANTREARTTLSRRVRLLIDFECEKEFKACAQGTLLLSYHSPNSNEKRVNTYWLRIAIQYANSAGAHRYHLDTTLSAYERNILKRLWWCCILRDRILPLGVRRSLNITPAHFDFTVSTFTMADFENEIERSRVYDSQTRRRLVELLVTQCELAVKLTDVIMTVCPLEGTISEKYLNVADHERLATKIDRCKSGLASWYERAIRQFPAPAGLGESHDSLILGTDLMYIYYHSAKAALCNREVLPSGVRPEHRSESYSIRLCGIRYELEEAYEAVKENLKELIERKLVRYLPISAVVYVAWPLFLHLLGEKVSSMKSQAAIQQQRVGIFLEVMKTLQSQYEITDRVLELVGRLTDVAGRKITRGQRFKPVTRRSMVQKTELELSKGFEVGSSMTRPLLKKWSDLFLWQTDFYLHVTSSLDFAFSTGGELPNNADLISSMQNVKLWNYRSFRKSTVHDPALAIGYMSDEEGERDRPEPFLKAIVEPQSLTNFIPNAPDSGSFTNVPIDFGFFDDQAWGLEFPAFNVDLFSEDNI